MNFSFFDYLQNYKKEELKAVKDLISEKWKLSVPVIVEAFNEPYSDKKIAIQKVKTELCDYKLAPKNIDAEFVKENVDYIVKKIETLTEGQIKIVINNASKESTPSITTECSTKKGKGKKTIQEKEGTEGTDAVDDAIDGLPADDVIIDDPNTVDAEPSIDEEIKEVTIKYDTEEEVLTVTEGDNELERLDIDKKGDTLKDVVGFMQKFYADHEYTVTLEGLDEILSDDKEDSDKDKEKGEDKEDEKENAEDKEEDKDKSDKENSEEDSEKNVKESFKIKFSQLLSEDFKSLDGTLTEVADFNVEEMVGKLVFSKGKWYSVVEGVENDPESINVLDESGNTTQLKISEIEEFEKEIPIDAEKLSESVVQDIRKVFSEDFVGDIMAYESGELSFEDTVKMFSELIKSGKINSLQGSYQRQAERFIDGGYLSPEGEILNTALVDESFSWLKRKPLFTGKGSATKSIAAIPKKPPKAALTAKPSKPPKKTLEVSKPSFSKKAAPKAALTSKVGVINKAKLENKKPSIKTKTASGGPAGKVSKPNQQHLSIKTPSVKKKPAPKAALTSKVGVINKAHLEVKKPKK